jgi:D-glycero-alpha-D-manno-heptose-7-phosphate kinase
LILRSRAPCRISFAGGGTDAPYYIRLRESGALVNATINVYAYAVLSPRTDGKIKIKSLDYNQEYILEKPNNPVYNGKLDLLRASIKKLNVKNSGFTLLSYAEASPGSGIGLSSAMTVALVGVLKEHLNLKMSKSEIADLAYEIERIELGVKGGFQDQYAAAFGGFSFMEFKNDKVNVTTLKLNPEILWELKASLLLCDVGETHYSGEIHERISEKTENMESGVLESLDRQKELAFEVRKVLQKGELDELGRLLHESWECKKRLDKNVSNSVIENIYNFARKKGAIGGKISGAGGGGHILLYCYPEKRPIVAKALKRKGCNIIRFDFDFEGLSIWKVQKEW